MAAFRGYALILFATVAMTATMGALGLVIGLLFMALIVFGHVGRNLEARRLSRAAYATEPDYEAMVDEIIAAGRKRPQ